MLRLPAAVTTKRFANFLRLIVRVDSLVAVIANRDKLKKEFCKDIPITQMVSLRRRLYSAAFTSTVRPLQNLGAFLPPLFGFQIDIVFSAKAFRSAALNPNVLLNDRLAVTLSLRVKRFL